MFAIIAPLIPIMQINIWLIGTALTDWRKAAFNNVG